MHRGEEEEMREAGDEVHFQAEDGRDFLAEISSLFFYCRKPYCLFEETRGVVQCCPWSLILQLIEHAQIIFVFLID